MKKKTFYAIASALIIAATITSCGSAEEAKTDATETATEEVTEEAAPAANGEELFTSNGCVACHQAEVKTVGPSLKNIATSYADNAEGLTAFLNGEGEAIVDPAQAAVMAPQVEVTKKMSPEDRNAITDYMLSM